VEHGLGYKSFYEPPMEIKRKLNRLAANLEILDEEFEDIRYGIALYNSSIDKSEKILKTDINKDSIVAYVNNSHLLGELAESIAGKYNFTITKDANLISQQKLITKLNFQGYQYIHELDADIIKPQELLKSIGDVMSERIYYDTSTLNLYSTILWFSFIPVVKNLIAGHSGSSEEVLDSVILDTFKNNNMSIFNIFSK